MSEKEPGMFYNIAKLNKVFAVLSFVFLISIIWLVLDDYIRPWKMVQLEGLQIKKEVLKKQVSEEDKKIDPKKVEELKADIKQAESDTEKKLKESGKLTKELTEIDRQIYVQNMENGSNGSMAGEFQFKYEHAISHNHLNEAKDYKKNFKSFKAAEMKGKDNLKFLQANKKRVQKQIDLITAEKINLDKKLDALSGARDRLLIALKRAETNPLKNPVFSLRNMPFIDYLDPTLKIQQVVVDNVTEDRYFQQVPRVDRCMTCHMFADQPGFEDQPQPYKTHPKLDELAVGANSAHPIKKFGCTSCHQGEGHKVLDFNAPVHVPQNLAQEKDWKKKYHWHEPHKVMQPMFPLQFTEASCVKCHQGVEKIPMATKLNEGRELIKDYGCYACHKIEGWQHLKKPGPALEKIAAKTTKEFIKNWIWSPHSFNKDSRMPAFFNQDNNSKPEFMEKNIAEVNAMAEYLWDKSKPYKAFAQYTGGSADNGKELIQTVGCISCHQVEGIDEPFNKVDSKKAPYLTGTGSKVDKDWLVSWLIKPSHYQEDTIMPSFRLSDKEANDITAYLMSLKNKTFEGLKFTSLDLEKRDELLLEYFSQFEPIEFAKEKLAKLSDKEKTMELGHRSLGKYGCYSCHKIEGFEEGRAPIGPELTFEGSKPLTQFGYGLQHGKVPHTREGWIQAHLKNPRIWDVGIPKAFKDLTRMPNFYLDDNQAQKITTAILGQVMDYVPAAGMKNLNAIEAIAEKGKKVVEKYNCSGCHKIDGEGGTILAAYEDDGNEGPPWLVLEGSRVNSDWFYNFLFNVHEIRPWLKVRMPSFNLTPQEANNIVAYFQIEAGESSFNHSTETAIEWDPGEREAAKVMWDELACTSCHTIGFIADEEALGPDLRNAKRRLRANWIEKWLTNPTTILPYTTMSDFWEGGTISAVDGVLGDDPKKQIKAMKKWILEMGLNKFAVPYRKPAEEKYFKK